MDRYLRQSTLVNQDSLKKSSVLVAGAGGLGSFIATYLALAGIGKLIIVDYDKVEESNLNRQVLYREADIGKWKVSVASEKIREINPDTKVIPLQKKIDEQFDAPYKVDIVVDALDNMPGRLAAERFAMSRNIPFVFGAVEGYMGMVSFIDKNTKKLEEIMKIPGKENPQVLGAIVGMTAAIQSMEVIKYLSGRGDLLRNRLLIYDALSSNFTEVLL